jgi:hypothetical protein
VETTKKTSTTKAALLVLAALSMLLSGLFIATASSSDAQDAPCPAGFTLNAAGTECSQASSVTTFDAGNSCVAPAFLSPTGANCWVEATATAQAGTTACPAGFSLNASNVCAANTAATASTAACPAGATGLAGACVVTTAAGTGPATCPDAGTALVGAVCQTTVAVAPTANTTCSLTLTPAWVTGDAPATCLLTYPEDINAACLPGDTGPVANVCTDPGTVTTSTTSFTCVVAGQAIVAGNCVSFSAVTAGAAGVCAAPSVANGLGACRTNVANATITYSCAAGTLNVSAATPPVYTCDTSSGFSATAGGVLYSCAAGTPAVVGLDILCDLGAATSGVTTGPSCSQGVLSPDAASCVVAVAAPVAAPVPAFTG